MGLLGLVGYANDTESNLIWVIVANDLPTMLVEDGAATSDWRFFALEFRDGPFESDPSPPPPSMSCFWTRER